MDGSPTRIKRLKKSVPVDRTDYILSVCVGKSVLDLGCTDYPTTLEKLAKGLLLFPRLHEVSGRLLGIDNSKEGITLLRSLGYSNIIFGDVEVFECFDKNDSFDIIIAGEILEHLGNVGAFLKNIRSIMRRDSILILTVPNAHSLKSFIRVLQGKEIVNSDHLYYFSQATVEHLCKRYNLFVEECLYYIGLTKPSGRIKKLINIPLTFFLKRVSPYTSGGLIFVIRCL